MAAAAQVVTLPDVAVELNQDVEVHTVLAYEVVTEPVAHVGDTEAKVRAYFEDEPIMIKVAYCESRFVHVNPETGEVMRGWMNPSDVGVMQINQYYHNDTAKAMNLDLLDFEDNLAYARNLYEREGTRPWNASRPCWQSATLAMR